MKRTLCGALVMAALLTSGCEGMRLMTTNIYVECTQQTAPATAKTGPSSKPAIDPSNLPSMDLKKPDKKTSSAGSALFQNELGSPLQVRFALPVDHFTESSCPTRDREVAAIPQITGVWCWAASAEGVMRFHDARREMNTRQCNIVDVVANGGEIDAKNEHAFCCGDENMWNGTCQQNGLPDYAFTKFGFDWNWVDVVTQGPLAPGQIKAQICQNGPFILVLHYTRNGYLSGGGHSLVVGDYLELGDKFYVWVNDHSYETAENEEHVPKPFELWSYDDYVNARWKGETTHQHSFDYVQISLPQ